MSNTAALHAKLIATDLDGHAAVHLDLHRLTFCDSQGGGLLLAFLNRAHHGGRETTIGGATPVVRRLLSIIADGHPPTFE